ncbi:aldo/keto reductase [Novosphingobium flavum]|uniref:Aldo/keto reductase n=1 Tax=Novosphingobium flavum TaxID=1778672 RepID=A0A7X1KN43_9SPHN|nr:aldo/keto reductase [Novosphingobium flavum]MBC2667033.1 aldo/keto reductase [Novosphingobium flavum]
MKRFLAGRPVNPIGLGCMGLSHGYGVPLTEERAEDVLLKALDLGYDHFDTARIYGVGRNELLIGRVLGGRRGEFLLASKMGIILDDGPRRIDCSPATIRRECEKSLKALGTDHIDLYYMHRPDYTVPIEESVGAMAELVREGKIGAIGLSEMNATTLRRAVAVHPIAAMQNEYSPWTRNVEIAVIEACAEHGVAMIAFSPVGRGALCGELRDVAGLYEGDLRRPMPRFIGENWAHNLELIDAFVAIAAELGVTPAQLSLGWVLAHGDHLHAIPGTTNLAHLAENVARMDWRPDAATVARINALFVPSAVHGHRYPEALRQQVETEEFAA